MPSSYTRGARLITIPFSHYCEKARWALEHEGVPFREEPHIPMFAWLPALRAGGRRTVPVLVTEDGRRLTDSHDIVRFAAPSLYPDDIASEVEALEATFDRRVGPAVRRIAYGRAMRDRVVMEELFTKDAPRWECAVSRKTLPMMITIMKRGLRIDDDGISRSEKTLATISADVEERLRDGRRWLFGDRFTAADLTLAALMVPVVVPPRMEARYSSRTQDLDSLIERHRETPAGRFAMRAYEDQR